MAKLCQSFNRRAACELQRSYPEIDAITDKGFNRRAACELQLYAMMEMESFIVSTAVRRVSCNNIFGGNLILDNIVSTAVRRVSCNSENQ